ncbi:MAG: hypothetical protein H8E66_20645 [Planctomycetes bacterium]|nr:hypothetical protein [Planctomycetota bacterium]
MGEALEAEEEDAPIICARCVKELTPGRGEFYVVEIDAKADPTPPVLGEDDMSRDFKSEINALVAELQDFTSQSQRLTIHLCMTCYASWIENPAG